MNKAYRAQQVQMVLRPGSAGRYPNPDDFSKPFADYMQKSLVWRVHYHNGSPAKMTEDAGGMQTTPQRPRVCAVSERGQERSEGPDPEAESSVPPRRRQSVAIGLANRAGTRYF